MAVQATPTTSSPTLKKLEEQLTCAECLGLYTEPKTLPCHHSFCQNCVEKLCRDSAITCPTCHHYTELPIPAGAAGFPAAIHLIQLREVYNQMKGESTPQQVICDNCSTTNAIGNCKECDQRLCQECIDTHKKWARFANHQITNLHETKASTSLMHRIVQGTIPNCHIHQEPLFFCEGCANSAPITETEKVMRKQEEGVRAMVGDVVSGIQNKVEAAKEQMELQQKKNYEEYLELFFKTQQRMMERTSQVTHNQQIRDDLISFDEASLQEPTAQSASLNIEDRKDVLDALKMQYFTTSDWRALGRNLGLSYDTLSTIENQYSKIDRQLEETICHWLRGKYDTTKHHKASWRVLVNALKEMREHTTADGIEKEKCTV